MPVNVDFLKKDNDGNMPEVNISNHFDLFRAPGSLKLPSIASLWFYASPYLLALHLHHALIIQEIARFVLMEGGHVERVLSYGHHGIHVARGS